MSDLETRFWSKVNRRGPDECWPWIPKPHSNGYGTFWMERRSHGKSWWESSHRVAFFLTHGRWPEPCCLHNCPSGDNPLCCNPAHLREGTQAENITDKMAKGRQAAGTQHGRYTKPERTARGERQGNSKLKEWQIPYIKKLLASGISQTHIGRAYGIDRSTVGHIARGKNWAHAREESHE